MTGLRQALQALPGALSDSLDALLSTLSQALNALLGALSKAFDAPLRALADTLNALLGPAADTRDSPSGSLTDVLHRAAGSLPDAAEYVAGVGEQIVSSGANVAQRLSDALQQRGVAVKRRQNTREDLRDLPETDFEQSLGLDVLDIQLDLAEPDRGAGIQLDEMADLGE